MRQRDRFSLAFVLFPLLVSIRLTSRIELACLAVLVVLSLLGKPLPGDRLSKYLPGALLVVVCGGSSLLRGAPRHEQIVMAITAVAVVLAGRRCVSSVAIRSLVTGISVYLWANILGWIIGLQSPAASVRVGLTEGRAFFPFTRSINEPAVVAAALLAFLLISSRTRQPVGRVAWLGAPAAVLLIALSGSRFPILIILALVVPALLIPRTARLVPLFAIGAMAVPYFFWRLTPLINWLAQLVADSFLDRDQQSVSDIAGGSSRATFWRIGLDYWHRVPDLSERLTGFGYNGHVQSHVVYLYYTQGGFVNDPAALTLHNTFLQQMYDTGYLGLAALITALALIGLRFSRARDLPTSAMIGVLYATSAIEVFLVPTFRTLPFLLVLALSVVEPSRGQRTESALVDDPAETTSRMHPITG